MKDEQTADHRTAEAGEVTAPESAGPINEATEQQESIGELPDSNAVKEVLEEAERLLQAAKLEALQEKGLLINNGPHENKQLFAVIKDEVTFLPDVREHLGNVRDAVEKAGEKAEGTEREPNASTDKEESQGFFSRLLDAAAEVAGHALDAAVEKGVDLIERGRFTKEAEIVDGETPAQEPLEAKEKDVAAQAVPEQGQEKSAFIEYDPTTQKFSDEREESEERSMHIEGLNRWPMPQRDQYEQLHEAGYDRLVISGSKGEASFDIQAEIAEREAFERYGRSPANAEQRADLEETRMQELKDELAEKPAPENHAENARAVFDEDLHDYEREAIVVNGERYHEVVEDHQPDHQGDHAQDHSSDNDHDPDDGRER